ncbi:aspartate/glutamate racemase family protein [Chloroflexota bacterium]
MERRAGMVHAVSSNIALFKALTSEIMPGIEIIHLVDEGLLFLSAGQSGGRVIDRLGLLASFAEESGAEVVMYTCTAFGSLVDKIQNTVNVPILAVLEIVAEEAIKLSDSIGVLASHPGTLESALQVIREKAKLIEKKVDLKALLCVGAFDAARRNNWSTHDHIVLEYLKKLMQDVGMVVIPQPSMERVLKQIPEQGYRAPVLSGGKLSVQRLKYALDSLPPSASKRG